MSLFWYYCSCNEILKKLCYFGKKFFFYLPKNAHFLKGTIFDFIYETITITICGLDKYDPIDLDAFNADAFARGRQLILSFLSSSLQAMSTFPLSASAAITPGRFSTHARSGSYYRQEPKVAGYHPIFGFYPVIPLLLQVSQSNLSLTLPTLTPMPTTDHGTGVPPAGLLFHPILLPI